MDYYKMIDITEQALDLIDLLPFLKNNMDLTNIRYSIEDYVDGQENEETERVNQFMAEHPEVFYWENTDYYDIFNAMDEDELLAYLKERYPEILWGYEIIEHHWIRGRISGNGAYT